jgi:uncharacterized phage infection (PIP) family protein YhgE
VIDLGTHIGQEISRVIGQTNLTITDYGKKVSEMESGIKKTFDDINNKFTYYGKEFVNTADNFTKLQEGQNKLFITLNSYDSELNKIKENLGDNSTSV